MGNKDSPIPEDVDSVPQESAGFTSSAINLLKTIMGAGMLALPSAFNSVGAVPGLFLLLIAAVVSGAGLQLLVLASDRVTKLGLGPVRTSNFAMLAQPTYPKASLLFEFAVMLKCSLVAASYMTLVRDAFPRFVTSVAPRAWGFLRQKFFWATFAIILIAPVCFMKRMDSLKYTSSLGMAGICYLFILAIVLFFGHNGSATASFNNIKLFVPFTFSSLSNFSFFVFALTCHQNIFPIYNEIKDNRPRTLLQLIGTCLTLSFLVYTLFALAFYGVFGSAVSSNVLENLPATGAPYSAAQLLYGILMLFSFPLLIFPARSSFVKLLGPVCGESDRTQSMLHIVTTSILLVGSWLVAVLNAPLALLLSIAGCTAGPVICYFLPAVFWWKLEEGKPLRGWKLMCVVLVIFGILATVIPFTALVLKYTRH